MVDTTIFEKQLELDIPSDLGIYYSGKRINTKNHVYGPEIRNHYLFVLVNNGSACLYGEKNIFLKPHEDVYKRQLQARSAFQNQQLIQF